MARDRNADSFFKGKVATHMAEADCSPSVRDRLRNTHGSAGVDTKSSFVWNGQHTVSDAFYAFCPAGFGPWSSRLSVESQNPALMCDVVLATTHRRCISDTASRSGETWSPSCASKLTRR